MLETIVLFIVLMVPFVFSAGPNNVMCATVGAKQQFLRVFPFIFGLFLANVILGVITGFGLGYFLEKDPGAFLILKYLGVLYITYLAIKLILSSGKTEEGEKAFGFIHGFMICILNAKAIIVFVLMYTMFLNPEIDKTLQIIVFTLGLTVMSLISHVLWAAAGRLLSKVLLSERSVKIQNYIFGGMLLAVVVWIIAS